MDHHGTRLTQFIREFVACHVDIDFRRLCTIVEAMRSRATEQSDLSNSWDQIDMHEILFDALDVFLRDKLEDALWRTRWLDRRIISVDELIELCLTEYVLRSDQQTFAQTGVNIDV